LTWTINRSNVTESRNIGTLPDGWSIAGTGDFNGDLKADIVFRKTTGDVAIWQMDVTTVVNARSFAIAPTERLARDCSRSQSVCLRRRVGAAR
jgi:hypothetical protein